ncbi:acylphosphatase-1 [Drosophila mojavensis]|uniref:Acylphosphatase n=1 Tax=Drosophila mojavensis TaxID=7230 RepID=B4K6N2_DROMO|nr:acylphosphatase-1 [Drosophila mojavensis]EDW16332.1 uncharacterized protein Dmoj_GI22288 [Drosophila mojavensis]
MATVHSCEFEVFGKVQGVYFRRHAEMKAKTLGLRGWCMNTADGTVKGYIEGPRTELNLMKEWLRTTGSPASNIVKAEFSEDQEKREYGFKNFHIRPDEPKAKNRRPPNKQNRFGKYESNP